MANQEVYKELKLFLKLIVILFKPYFIHYPNNPLIDTILIILPWMTEDGALADLFRLYVHRGDLAKAKEYFKSISDREYKFQILQMLIGDIFHSEEELERARRLSEAFEDAF